jgi:SAM-dependent methyltransferase
LATEAGGDLFATDEPIVAECLSGHEPGVALDAACGTGRFAEFLAQRGHRVIGVDSDHLLSFHGRVGGEQETAQCRSAGQVRASSSRYPS